MDGENAPSSKSRNLTYLLIVVLIIIVLALVAAGLYIGHDKINNLAKSLDNTQKQVEEVKKDSQKAKEDNANEATSRIKETADAIKDIDNPAVRLALAQAYAANFRPLLSASGQTDLDSVMVYLNENPKALVIKNTTLPKSVSLSITNLKARVKNLKVTGVATMQKVDKELYAPNEIANLTGIISYVGDDEYLIGGVFTLTDSKTGYVYYLEVSKFNSENIENTMDNKLVTVQVKVTSKTNEPLTVQVLKGPTLVAGVSQTLSPTSSPTKAVQTSPAPQDY